MIMAVLYAPDDFQRAQMIVNTSGWDTDCNAGNVGCLLGIMHGLDGLEAGPDWRGPVADRLLISSADGGNSINDAVRMSYYLTNLGRVLAGSDKLEAPKGGAQFHFSLPGSQQGFRQQDGHGSVPLSLRNVEFESGRALSLGFAAMGPGQEAAVMTPTFSPPDVLNMRTYDLMATPLVYPGQTVRARVVAGAANAGPVQVRLRVNVYDAHDKLRAIDGAPVILSPGQQDVLEWRLPEFDGQPIAEIGLSLSAAGKRADGTVLLDYLGWTGTPSLKLHRPQGDGDFWRMAWVNGVDFFSKRFPPSFRISQGQGTGLVSHGTRQWTDYQVSSDIVLHLGTFGGVAARVQGLRRYYAARILRSGQVQIVRVRDEETIVLAEAAFPTELEKRIRVVMSVKGRALSATIDDVSLTAIDESEQALLDGGIGLLVADGALSTDEVLVGEAG
jgi:hypothetical protein